MLRAHFDALQPLCPSCLVQDAGPHALVVGLESRRGPRDDELLDGALRCPHCDLEFPVVDGIPILVPDPARYLAENVESIRARDDLTPELEAMLGEACGPGSSLDVARCHLSSYVQSHYGDFEVAASTEGEVPDTRVIDGILPLLEHGFALAPESSGHALDLGCSVGRSTFELARRSKTGLALGVDKSFAMLRLARRVRATGRVRYARRRVGLLYDQREFSIGESATVGRDRVDFWVADAAALPFAPATFGRACAWNLLDATFSPLDVLREIDRILEVGGSALLATPWDWSGAVTEPAAWIGGHSPRGFAAGDSAAVLRALLGGDHPVAVHGLRLEAEIDRVPWRVAIHERSTVEYATHVVLARRVLVGAT